MIYHVDFFVWEEGRVTHKSKTVKVDKAKEVWGKLRQGYNKRLISIRKLGVEDGQHDKDLS
jgi:hypothetical protein